MINYKLIVVFILLSNDFCAVAREKTEKDKEKKCDVSNPEGPCKDVSFTVNEGTGMNVDMSPDGKEIVFDLLGDIYTIPATGGEAKLLRGAHAFEVQPRFSPDGKKILFTSDAGGGDNICTMNRGGNNATQITKESFRLLNNAAWHDETVEKMCGKH